MKTPILFACCLSQTFLLATCWIVDFNNPIVHTQFGSIRGKIDERKTKFNRRPICTFLSIPFARPPVGANRFLVSICGRARMRLSRSVGTMKLTTAAQPPVEPDAWQNLEATSKRVMCPQVEQRFRLFVSPTEPIVESEDCLYLNVFVPVDVSMQQAAIAAFGKQIISSRALQ